MDDNPKPRRAVTYADTSPTNSAGKDSKKLHHKFPMYKLSRTLSSPFLPGYNSDEEKNGIEVSGIELESEFNKAHKKNPRIDSAQTESLLNMTLISSASPFHINKPKTTIPVGHTDEASFGSNDSNDFNLHDSYKIEAVSPSSGSPLNSSAKEPRHENIQDVIDDFVSIRESVSIKEGDRQETTNGNVPSESLPNPNPSANNPNENNSSENNLIPIITNVEPILNSPSGNTILNPPSGNSILNALKGNSIMKKSIFKEQSALLSDRSATSFPNILEPLDSPAFEDNSFEIPNQTANSSKDSSKDDPEYIPDVITITKRKNNAKTYLSITFILLFFISICVLIPLVIMYSRGNEDSTLNYIRRLNETERDQLFEAMKFDYNRNITPIYNQADDEINALLHSNLTTGKIFKGITYTPINSLEPICGSTQRDVELDVALLSTLTTKLRTYGMGCYQNEYILNAIQKFNLDIKLSMGVWIGSNVTINEIQLSQMKNVLKKYPRKLFDSIIIGNEVLFREDMSTKQLIKVIKEVKKFTRSIGYMDLPIGTSDIGSEINQELLKECDIIGANIHPFFGGGDVNSATNWTLDFLKFQLDPLNEIHNTKIVISEVGWPYQGGRFQGAVANQTNFQTFLNDWICSSKHHHIEWYYFEGFDEPWKRIFYEGNNKWETEFGIFTSDRKMKPGITFPKCL